MSDVTLYAAGTCFPPIIPSSPLAPQKFSVGHIVQFDPDLIFEKYYDTYVKTTTGTSPNYNACFQGITSNNSNLVACGGRTRGWNSWTSYSTLLVCYNQDSGGDLSSVKWWKTIELNGLPNIWQFVVMDNDYMYVATQNQTNHLAPLDNPARSTTTGSTAQAVIMSFAISDGSVAWAKRYILGATGITKGFTSLKLAGNVLYASFSVSNTNGGLDYIKVDPSNGFVTNQTNIVTTSTMTSGGSTNQYQIQTTDASGNNLEIVFNDSTANYLFTVTGTTLDSTNLSTAVSDQVEIRADTSSVQRYD
tara:strand:+ start:1047 stop:1961 length:915 start_codon:yes stop_codon:yes gene_type:complete